MGQPTTPHFLFESVTTPQRFGATFDFFDLSLASHLKSWPFITTLKGYAGLGANTCQPGNQVVILLGCAAPLILRPVRPYYELVGEYYIHGIMHGEAMPHVSQAASQMVDFEIR
jgi:hypothetical protein